MNHGQTSRVVRDFQAILDDIAARRFIDWCPSCRRDTVWRLVSIVAGRQVYRCQECRNERTY